MYPSLKQQNSGDTGLPVTQLPPPPQSSSTRRLSGGNSITKNTNGVTSIKISTPPSSSIPSPSIGILNCGTSGSVGGRLASTPNKYNDQLNVFEDDSIDDELALTIPESDSVPSRLPPRRIPGHRSNRIGLSVSASSSPEAGVSPHTLAEQGWKSFDDVDEDKWVEEGRLLIEPGDDEEDDDGDTCSTRKHRESDEDEEDDGIVDIWSMSKDQQEYYRKQFQSLLGSGGGSKVSGSTAKEFFIKSKLPSSELATIWQLSDIDKDGSLNLAEFSIAMHLVVMRQKVSVDVPSSLPKSLVTSALKISPALLNHNHGNGEHFSCTKNQNIKPSSSANLIDMSSSPGGPPVSGQHFACDTKISSIKDQNKEWTKFTDSPTAKKNKPVSLRLPTDQISKVNSFNIPSDLSSGDDSSQGLANFDFPRSSIGCNPSIVHPVAMRLTPEGQLLVASPEPSFYICLSGADDERIVPPPLPPPRIPKRPTTGHARSSSLDLNKLHSRRSTWSSNGNSGQFHYGLPPSNIASMSPSNLIVGANDDHHGAFSVYKKSKSPLPTPSTDSEVENESYVRTLRVIQSQFCLEPIPSLIPNNPCDMNELKRCLKLSNDRIVQLEQINEILMEKLAEMVDKNIDLESKYSKIKAATDLIRNKAPMSTVSTAASFVSSTMPNQSINSNAINTNSSVQCTKI